MDMPMKKNTFVCCIVLILMVAFCTIASAESSGVISGKWITRQYGPMTGGQVLVFNAENGPAPASNKFLRLPDAGTSIDGDGKFSVKVPAGKYYLVMRKRAIPDSAGPPEEGDPQYYARLKSGEPRAFTVTAGKITDIGTISTAEPFKKEKLLPKEGMTGIEGTVNDEQGQPVAGVRVFAYSSPEMLGRPLYASDATGADGKYFLNVNQQGTYYLKARTHYGGGKPAEGEFMGGYGKSGAPDSVVVEKGQIVKGIDLQGKRFSSKRKSEP